ncbi:TPA: hypothetical protein G8L55_004537 [Salmonella enterica]|uniref:Uncharacterized protein n=1 Tax=Salmonella enterica TaxID=28901 RepID=A0A742P5L7_SALER|nr:hypothetical protein [Salmonella enterica]ECB6455281.1 hypothetical protein [Salmonella enterica subsp. enterica serovar Newport]ECY3272656.1 hypothetical protein [Salmonella enterica subsp. enterica serovar Abony]EDW1164500.1 hypothetical protein [Salmonella enterica subsp. enterica]EGI6168354.1 hypothetical protein [Salmonella enterica subsp. enterica serovar Hermannswerder]
MLTSESRINPASFATSYLLTPAQQHMKQVMDARINNTGDRKIILHEWSDAHRVAGFLCRLQSLKPCGNKNKKADKVFLGNGKNGGLNLQPATILTGAGQCRTDGTVWKIFSFSCELSPVTGGVTNFRSDANRLRPMAPEPIIITDTRNISPRLK